MSKDNANSAQVAPKKNASCFNAWKAKSETTLLVFVDDNRAFPKNAKKLLQDQYRLAWYKKAIGNIHIDDKVANEILTWELATQDRFEMLLGWGKDCIGLPKYDQHFDSDDNEEYKTPVCIGLSEIRDQSKNWLNMNQKSVKIITRTKIDTDDQNLILNELKKYRVHEAVIVRIITDESDPSHNREIHVANFTTELELCNKDLAREKHGIELSDEAENILSGESADSEKKSVLKTYEMFSPYEFPYPKIDRYGQCVGGISHMVNLKYLLDRYGITLKYNVITKRGEAQYPNKRRILLDNKEGQILEEIAGLCSMNGYPTERLVNQISAISNDNPYNPIQDFFTSKPWDGVDRLQRIIDTVVVDNDLNEWKSVAIKKYMIAAACAAINDEDKRWKFKCVLVFQGAQGVGKSPWIRLLVGDMVSYFLEGYILDPSNRDSCMAALETWITELAELDATVGKSDVAAQKAFLDAGKDKHRLPFAIRHSEMIRRTVFFGTVNPAQFLVDNTGNDRFWCLPVLDLDLDAVERMDTQQLWAQIYEIAVMELSNGVPRPWELTDDEQGLMSQINEASRVVSATEERLMDVFEPVRENPVKLYATITNIMDMIGLNTNNIKDKTIAESYIQRTFGSKKTYYGKRNSYPIPVPLGFENRLEHLVIGLKMKVKNK